jgi:hypothetical protein
MPESKGYLMPAIFNQNKTNTTSPTILVILTLQNSVKKSCWLKKRAQKSQSRKTGS